MDVESRGALGHFSKKVTLHLPQKNFLTFLETKVDSSAKFTDKIFLRKIVSNIVTFYSIFSFHTILDPSRAPVRKPGPGQPTHLSPL